MSAVRDAEPHVIQLAIEVTALIKVVGLGTGPFDKSAG